MSTRTSRSPRAKRSAAFVSCESGRVIFSAVRRENWTPNATITKKNTPKVESARKANDDWLSRAADSASIKLLVVKP